MRLLRKFSFATNTARDYALFDPNLQAATNGTYTSRSADYPTILYIGSSYFDSYSTWPGVKYIHGFNLGKNGSVGFNSLVATIPLACKALEGGKLAYWELGNEPDLYKTSSQGAVRPSNWTEAAYVAEWLNKTRALKPVLADACPDLVDSYEYFGLSFAGVTNSLNPVTAWRAGIDADQDIGQISIHKWVVLNISTIADSIKLHRWGYSAWGDPPRDAHESYLNCDERQQVSQCLQHSASIRFTLHPR